MYLKERTDKRNRLMREVNEVGEHVPSVIHIEGRLLPNGDVLWPGWVSDALVTILGPNYWHSADWPGTHHIINAIAKVQPEEESK